MTYSVRNIVIAVAMAIAAGLAVVIYTSSYKQSVQRGQARVAVLVATTDIPAGTSDTQVASMVTVKRVLRDDLVPGALTAPSQFSGQTTQWPIAAGAQVVRQAFQRVTSSRPQFQLGPTQRGIRITLDSTTGILGDVSAGDHVDVFMTLDTAPQTDGDPTAKTTKTSPTPGGVPGTPVSSTSGGSSSGSGNDVFYSRLLLKDVTVLEAPDPNAQKKGGLGSGGGGTDKVQIMLAVQQRDAAKIAWAGANTDKVKLWLALRPPVNKAQDQSPTIETPESMLGESEPPTEIRAKVMEAAKLLGLYVQGQDPTGSKR